MITFLIPSLGRPYLHETIKSLHDQTLSNWKAIVMFDGVPSTIEPSEKIHIIESTKIGCPSNMRNIMIELVDTEWIGFVDDDNTLKSTYVEKVQHYSQLDSSIDIIHFSMLYTWNNQILPPNNLNDLVYGQFGMSFAVKKNFIKNNNVYFPNNEGSEDFKFLTSSKTCGGNILITHDVQYIVPKISSWRF